MLGFKIVPRGTLTLRPIRRIRCFDPGSVSGDSHAIPDNDVLNLSTASSVVNGANQPPDASFPTAIRHASSILSTARRVTASNSRSSASTLPAKTRAFSSESVRTASRRKAAFFNWDSARTTRISGRQRAIGTPGKPPPEPKSSSVQIPAGKFCAAKMLSPKCLWIIPSGVRMAVRFRRAFHFKSRSR